MIFPILSDPAVARRKAKLARRRSPLVWPKCSYRSVQHHVRVEARITLRESIRDYWRAYRLAGNAELRAILRSALSAKVTALRLLF